MTREEFAEHARTAVWLAHEFQALSRADLKAIEVCHVLGYYGPEQHSWQGHAFEGRLIFEDGIMHAVGQCSRCGVDVCIDGS